MEGLQFMGDLDFISRLFHQIYQALAADSRQLAVMGLRALLEGVMIEKVGDQKSFAANLSKLCADGFISVKNKEVLAVTLDAGHASMHRNYVPTVDALRLVLDITENVVESIYVAPFQAEELKRSIPPRKSAP